MERVLPVQAAKVSDDGRLRAFVAELGLKPGQTVEARVAAMLSDGLARLVIDDRPLDVRTPQPLPVGQTLTLTVERQGQALRLILGSLPAAEAARPASAGSGPPPAPVVATPGMPAPAIGGGASAAASTVAAQILIAQAAATGDSAPAGTLSGPTGVAPPNAALTGPSMPAGTAAASSVTPSVSAAQPPPPAAALAAGTALVPPPGQMRDPPRAGGQFASAPAIPAALPAAGAAGAVAALVALAARDVGKLPTQMDGARIAVAARGAAAAGRLAGTAESGERLDSAPKLALNAAVRQAADRQESLAPLFADLAAVAEGRAPAALRAMPEPVLRAMAAVLGFRLPVEAASAPQALARAVTGSGTFLEARLAALQPGAPVPADLKAALGGLREALADWRASLPASTAGDAGDPQAVERPALHARPPLRGSLPEGQRPSASTIGAGATPSEVALILADRTESALARILLLQVASLPGGADAGRPDAPLQTMVEVPLRLGAETAVMQMMVIRDDPEGHADRRTGPAGRSWTLRFSMDAEPLGPVHAAVRWQAGHVAVQLWAERDGTADRLAAARAALSDALEASAFAIDELSITAGRPADPVRPSPSPRLDRLS
jgi:hypothetical protein